MKNIKFILGIIVGVIISGLGVYALSINSRDVAYNDTNVSEALDDLYEKAGAGSGNISFITHTNFTYQIPDSVKEIAYVCGANPCTSTYGGNSISTSAPFSLNARAGLNPSPIISVNGGSFTISATYPTYGIFLVAGKDLEVYSSTSTAAYTVVKDSDNAVALFGNGGSVTVNGVSYSATTKSDKNGTSTIYTTIPFPVKTGDTITFSTSSPAYGIMVIY